ncbi:cupredoxin domain-containing protein [uncultured Rhodoblastus sp.]|uniref:cupredoxin domain-containing protein n=1 Tax=uncultured Rhodoblastus sp. TaxID=543037 RepID=UPI0025FE6ECC|nr:cupredoxin domain-containing protein [uncultured Rhodoblastus sp.]
MIRKSPIRAVALGLLFLAEAGFCAPAQSANVTISIQDHKFDPPEPHAPANQPITLVVKNLDQTPAEFESKQLKVEKMVIGGGEITLQIRPMPPGRYRFFDDYHQDDAAGFLVVE